MEIASSPTSPSRTSRSVIRTESPTHPGSNYRVRREPTLSWERVAGPKALTGVGRQGVGPGTAPFPAESPALCAFRGRPRFLRVWRGPLKTKDRPHVCSPRRRSPSPTGKVDRAQPGPDEGKQPKSEKQATLNGSVLHSMWPVLLLRCGPSSVTPYGVPPSPQGKAASRRGSLTFPWGKVPPQRRKRGGTGLVQRTAPHPSGLRPATLSQERVFPSSGPGCARSTFPVGEGFLRRRRFLTVPLAFQTFFPFTPFTNPLLCCKIGSSSQKLWEVWS